MVNAEYTNLYQNLPFGQYATGSTPQNHLLSENRALNARGLPTRGILGYSSLDCTTRPWYLTALRNQIPSWQSPFLLSNNKPAISFVVPLINMTYANRTVGFVGALSFNVQLSQISKYLRTAYNGSANNVFIMDRFTGYLVATSLKAKTYRVVNGVNVSVSHGISLLLIKS